MSVNSLEVQYSITFQTNNPSTKYVKQFENIYLILIKYFKEQDYS